LQLTEHFLPPDPVPEPPHILMLFDAYKFRDVFEICDKYPEQILASGFFTDATGKMELIAKTLDKYQVNKPAV
jgi:thioredoxin domain-containing protein 3